MIDDILLNVVKEETMFNKLRRRPVNRDRKFIQGRRRAPHVYSILAASKNSCDDDGISTSRRHHGDDVPIDKISKSLLEKMTYRGYFFVFVIVIRVLS